jgi:hypothetical protein
LLALLSLKSLGLDIAQAAVPHELLAEVELVWNVQPPERGAFHVFNVIVRGIWER